jgi:hypothetical protein
MFCGVVSTHGRGQVEQAAKHSLFNSAIKMIKYHGSGLVSQNLMQFATLKSGLRALLQE